MPEEFNAPITDVTVYTNRARVTRSGEIELHAGETTLILSGLPSVMDADSVRVSGKGAGITIRGVDVKPDVQEEADSKQSLQAELKAKQREVKAFEHEHKSLEEQIEYFKALKTQSSEESGMALLKEETSFERVSQIADYIREQLQKTYERMRDIGYQWADLNEEIEALKIRLADNTRETVKKGQAVHIAVEAEEAMKFAYEIEYLVNEAYWYPIYDARLLEDNSVELTYMAQVKQETGEDWEEVNLALSTARPALTSGLPEPKAWYVSDAQPYQRQAVDQYAKYSAPPPSAEQLAMYEEERSSALGSALALPVAAAAAIADAIPKPQAKASTQQATISESSSGAVVTYGIGTPVSVPAVANRIKRRLRLLASVRNWIM